MINVWNLKMIRINKNKGISSSWYLYVYNFSLLGFEACCAFAEDPDFESRWCGRCAKFWSIDWSIKGHLFLWFKNQVRVWLDVPIYQQRFRCAEAQVKAQGFSLMIRLAPPRPQGQLHAAHAAHLEWALQLSCLHNSFSSSKNMHTVVKMV